MDMLNKFFITCCSVDVSCSPDPEGQIEARKNGSRQPNRDLRGNWGQDMDSIAITLQLTYSVWLMSYWSFFLSWSHSIRSLKFQSRTCGVLELVGYIMFIDEPFQVFHFPPFVEKCHGRQNVNVGCWWSRWSSDSIGLFACIATWLGVNVTFILVAQLMCVWLAIVGVDGRLIQSASLLLWFQP